MDTAKLTPLHFKGHVTVIAGELVAASTMITVVATARDNGWDLDIALPTKRMSTSRRVICTAQTYKELTAHLMRAVQDVVWGWVWLWPSGQIFIPGEWKRPH